MSQSPITFIDFLVKIKFSKERITKLANNLYVARILLNFLPFFSNIPRVSEDVERSDIGQMKTFIRCFKQGARCFRFIWLRLQDEHKFLLKTHHLMRKFIHGFKWDAVFFKKIVVFIKYWEIKYFYSWNVICFCAASK